jgi:hypothetical protein
VPPLNESSRGGCSEQAVGGGWVSKATEGHMIHWVRMDCPTQKFIAATACLKRALYLGPFEWTTAFNLGLVRMLEALRSSVRFLECMGSGSVLFCCATC